MHRGRWAVGGGGGGKDLEGIAEGGGPNVADVGVDELDLREVRVAPQRPPNRHRVLSQGRREEGDWGEDRSGGLRNPPADAVGAGPSTV